MSDIRRHDDDCSCKGCIAYLTEVAAKKERARIRRLQAKALRELRDWCQHDYPSRATVVFDMFNTIDAATLPKSNRKVKP